jgi:hypothetical protein
MQQKIVIPALILALSCITGCHFDEDKHGDGKDVKFTTPFGGMQVKTNQDGNIAGLGLPVYPGAVPVKKVKSNGDTDGGSADINMSFGSFQLKVKAVDYRSDDSPQKLFDFYKKALGRYGSVIQCHNDRPVGTPTRTDEGLTCEESDHDRDRDRGNSDSRGSREGAAPFDGSAKVQLKAGSRKHQHIVDINPDNGGSKFGLVALDLPVDFNFGDKSDKPDKPDHDDRQ